MVSTALLQAQFIHYDYPLTLIKAKYEHARFWWTAWYLVLDRDNKIYSHL